MIKITAGLCFVILLINAAFTLLPGFVEHTVIPALHRQTNLFFSSEVREIGLYGADLSNLAIGDANTPFLRAGSLRLDYSPTALLQKK